MVTFFKALDSRHQSSLGSSLAPFSTAWTTIICFFQAYQKMSAIVNLEKKIVQNFQKTISGPNFQRKEKTQICFLFCYHPYHFTLSETVEYVIVGFFRLVKIVSKFPIQNALSFYCVMFTKYLS